MTTPDENTEDDDITTSLKQELELKESKLLRNTGFEEYQMFNLAKDPGETTPIERQKAPQKYNELFQALMRHINHAGKVPWQRLEEGVEAP